MNTNCVLCLEQFKENDILIDFIKMTAVTGSFREGRYLRSASSLQFQFKNKDESFCHLGCLKEKMLPLDYEDTATTFNPLIVRRLAQLDE